MDFKIEVVVELCKTLGNKKQRECSFLLIYRSLGVVRKEVSLRKKWKGKNVQFRQMFIGKKKKKTEGISMVAKSWPDSPFYFEVKPCRVQCLAHWRLGKGQPLLKIGWEDLQVEGRETNEQLENTNEMFVMRW